MNILEILEGTGASVPQSLAGEQIAGIASDSRKIRPGYLFVCLRGTKKDGNDFIADAFARGAVAAVTDRETDGEGVIRVPDACLSESVMWNNFTGSPSRGMRVIAVTGTNGKTTVAMMIREIFRRAGSKTGVITTVGVLSGDDPIDVGGGSSVSDADAAMTTPDPEVFYPAVAAMRDAGVGTLIFEASSHALDRKKLDPLRVDVAVFTNLTEEHLDYHGTMEDYFRAKSHLADLSGTLVINGDDPFMRRLSARPGAVVCRTDPPGSPGPCSVRALRVKNLGEAGIEYLYSSRERVFPVYCPAPGGFTVQNTMLAATAALASGVPRDAVTDALSSFRGAPGRLERVTPPTCPFSVYVDYAHTPAALEALLHTVREMRSPGGRITVVFGCGGDRDRSKRKRMGAIASSLADLTVVTGDNPRSEDPSEIISEIVKGVDREKPYAVIRDRREAILYALSEAKPGDIVVLAGKGHEKYEITAEGKRPFDEVKIVTDYVEGGRIP
ncbi:MAG: UDP-N-acetylmuramoyl-L-alanyl-D-glutamate--2,6-diaminopimelate ligase [Clostridia bacterium]|nr:UDP-N-acetylmuramoyl-L-alanyl-D-glutamate--2,6-diaminopimelate ligase [Clostridia bacterium]